MLSIEDLKNGITEIYKKFRDMRDAILKNGQLAPYIEHQYAYMCKAFSLFVDYYNQYCYSLPLAIKKMQEDLNDLPEDE